MNEITFIIDKNNNPLTPTFNQTKVREMLKDGNATIVNYEPFFTIKLNKVVKTSTPTLTLGIDAGYSFVGFSLIDTHQNELIGGELKLRNDIKGLLESRSNYRRTRRSRLRYRKSRFNNRRLKNKYIIDGGKVKSLPPSISNKIESHLTLIDKLYKIAPINKINIELANFDIQKIKNPDIEGDEYQKGTQFGFWNLREAVLARDNHKCQNPYCKHKSNILSVHHIVYKSEGGTNSPSNLITLCTDCHIPKNHKPGGFLFKWMKEKKKVTKNFKDSTFMNIMRWNIFNELKHRYGDIINMKYGFNTKSIRIKYKIPKTHHKDAYVIAGGTADCKTSEPLNLVRIRRNHRSIESFRDTKFYDIRDITEVENHNKLVELELKKLEENKNYKIDKSLKQKKEFSKFSGSALSNGRTKRNKNLNGENYRKYRKPILDENGVRKKVTKGKRIFRTQRSKFQKGTRFEMIDDFKVSKLSLKKGERFTGLGSMNKGTRVYHPSKISVPANKVKIISKKNWVLLVN